MSIIRPSSVFVACSLFTAAAPALAQPASDAEAGWAAMARCAAIVADETRHACTDEVLRNAGLTPSPEAAAAERRRRFGAQGPARAPSPPPAKAAQAAPASAPAEPAPPPLAAAPAPAPSQARAPSPPSAPKAESPNRVDVTLAKVELGGDGKLILTTAEGAVWAQVESDPIRPPPAQGQQIVIQRTALGGFMCRAPGRTPFRCVRRP